MPYYDIVGDTAIIGAMGADPDMRALMSNDPILIGQVFTGRVPAMRQAMSKLAQLATMPAGGGIYGQQRPQQVSSALAAIAQQSAVPVRLVRDRDDWRWAEAQASNTPVAVEEREPTNAFEVPFGFESLAVPAATTIQINLSPAATFKPNRMSIPQAVAPSFSLLGFLIGQESLILNGNAVPAEAFSDLSYNPRGWKLPTMQVGQPSTMLWRNNSGAAADLRGNFWGIYIK